MDSPLFGTVRTGLQEAVGWVGSSSHVQPPDASGKGVLVDVLVRAAIFLVLGAAVVGLLAMALSFIAGAVRVAHATRSRSGGWEGRSYVPVQPLGPRPPGQAQAAARPALELANAKRQPAVPRARDLRKKAARPGASQVAVASVDATRRALRFAARSCHIGADGIDVDYERGGARQVSWAEVARLVVRQLPPEPPFERLLLLDIVLSGGEVVRLLPSTIANYADLPGANAATSKENLRRLAAHVAARSPRAVVEPESEPFVELGLAPPAMLGPRQFDDYDAQYG